MFNVEDFLDEDGSRPFKVWLDRLDKKFQARVLARITRFQDGNFGDHRRINENIFEARFFFGSGYRVYFAKLHRKVVLLLCGGDKSKQNEDIKQAKMYLRKYLEN